MPMNLDSVGEVSEPGERSWTSQGRAALRARCRRGPDRSDRFRARVHDRELSQNVKQRVLPTYAGHRRHGRRRRDAELRRLQLGDARARRAARRGASARSRPTARSSRSRTIVGIYDKGSGALAVMETESKYKDTGKPAFNTRFAAFIRGEGGFGESRGDGARRPAEDARTRTPDHEVTYATRPDQALLYRLYGDRNPLHSDPAFAKLAGFAEADPARPLHLRLHRPGAAARAVRLRPRQVQGHGRALLEARHARRRR